MEPLECYTIKVEPQDSPKEEWDIKTEPFEDDPIDECPIKTEPIQNDPIEECPIKTEPFQDISLEECPIKTETVDNDLEPESPQDEDTLSEDPLEPTLRQKRLDSQAKLMILNVHKYFRKFRLIRAKETGEDMNVNLVVAQATGVSESAVKRLYSEYLKKGTERAIEPHPKSKTRKKKTDIVDEAEAEEKPATITVKNKRKRK